MRSLDELRARFPDVGFALYALEPAGVVTLEVHADGQVFTFYGSSETAAIEAAFPTPPVVETPDLFD